MPTRPTIDVSHLPPHGMDARSPLWWGNTLMIFIETTTVALMIAVYFYLRRNFNLWPPPQPNAQPAILRPLPDLGFATANLILLILSCPLMYWTDQMARKLKTNPTRIGLVLIVLIAALSTYLRYKEFDALKFRWDDNAYGSVTLTILGLHMFYILMGLGEMLLMTVWIMLHGLDEKHALDITLMGGYWYWVVLTWIVLYTIVFWYPRMSM